MTTEI